jgi:hypothetical protein
MTLGKFTLFGIFAILWLLFVLIKRPSSRVSLVLGLILLSSGIPFSLLRKHAEADMAMIYAFFLLGVGIFQEVIGFILNPPKE